MEFWRERLHKFGISTTETRRFGETYLHFRDTDGLQLELVERAAVPLSTWSFGGVPANQAIQGFGGAVLYSMAPEKTAALLETVMGLQELAGLLRGAGAQVHAHWEPYGHQLTPTEIQAAAVWFRDHLLNQ